ncbi:hypothetical protein AALP_AA6G035800 [Arabis alpina]|uniref:TF-B3 domain-containing protein n=1 Tax=Arabis alpina TaxID=50452 RepID=A0A087GLW3_ARAAL|nr:hypothetical protein AALP_AA6G035800 [Arabis alpina]
MSLSGDPLSSSTKKNQEPHQDSSFLRHKEPEMPLSDDPLSSPTKKNQDSSFLRHKELEMSLSNDPLSSPTEKNQEPHQDFSFLSSKETEKKSQTSTSQETEVTNIDEQVLKKSETSTSQETHATNGDEQVLKSQYGSFWENPNYYESVMNTGNLFNTSGNMSSQIDPPDPIQKNPTSEDFKTNNNDESYYLNLEDSDGCSDLQWLFHSSETQMGEEGYGTNTCDAFRNKSNISLGPYGSIESMMKLQRDREEIKMIPTPGLVNRAEWAIKKILKTGDVSTTHCRLKLPKSSLEPYFQKHLPEAYLQKLVQDNPGIIVNMYDHDTKTTHKVRLALAKYYYVIMGGWRKAFITRRCLRKGQQIGLYWGTSDSMLHFTVLDDAYGKALAEEKKPVISQLETYVTNCT